MAIPIVLNAIALLPEVTIPAPSLNDDAFHYLFIQRASDALASGGNVFDHWLPQIEAGFPQFLYYQHLPALVVVGLQRLSFGNLDLLTTFNLVRYVLLVGLPLTVFVSMRWFGFSTVAAAMAAAASTLLSSDFRYGFEYDSFVWRGLGVFTQLWAMHLSFLTVAALYRAVHLGRRLWVAALLLGLLVLTHLLYSYMMAIMGVVIALWGIRRSNLIPRLRRLIVVGAFAAYISAYMWVPYISRTAYVNATPYLQQEKYDSFGAPQILTWLFNGELLDHGRLPVLTVLLAIGCIAALLFRSRAALLSLGLFVVMLVVYFGRPTLGPIADLFPLHDGLLFHRFIGGVDLAAIVLIGLGGALVWGVFRPNAARWRLAAAMVVLVAVMVPALVERSGFYSLNTVFMQRTEDAVRADPDAAAILAKLESLPPARIFAGLPKTYGKTMAFGDVAFYNLLAFHALDGFAPPNESLSLNADYIWDFRDTEQADYDLYNARYVVAPSAMAMAGFLTPIMKTSRYTLYQAPTSGYAEYVGIQSRIAVDSQTLLFNVNRAWERGAQSGAVRTYIRYDYPASVPGTDPTNMAACPDGGRTDYERFQPDQMDFVVECPAAATLVIKTTYHPNWEVTVDGVGVPTFMVSPSYIGISLPAGKHEVDAVYQAVPIKTPLIIAGAIAIVLLLLLRGRLDSLGAPEGAVRRPRRDPPLARRDPPVVVRDPPLVD